MIKDKYYNLIVSRYIHLNPVKANLVLDPLDYKWSSYSVYMGLKKSELVDQHEILDYFGDKSDFYSRFVMFGKKIKMGKNGAVNGRGK